MKLSIARISIACFLCLTACGGASPSDLFDPAPTVVTQEASTPDAEVTMDAGADAPEGNFDAPDDVFVAPGQTTCVFSSDSGTGAGELQCTAAMCAATGFSPWEHVVAGSWVGCCTPVGAITSVCQVGDPCRTVVAGTTFYGVCQ